MTDEQIKALSFEQALAKLEEIVAELESGRAELERSVEVYALGAKLKAHCEAKLEAARLKVEQIVVRPGGVAEAQPADFS